MFFVALAVDYDGTLARDGRVDALALAALKKVKRSGRKLILVTGRDHQCRFPRPYADSILAP